MQIIDRLLSSTKAFKSMESQLKAMMNTATLMGAVSYFRNNQVYPLYQKYEGGKAYAEIDEVYSVIKYIAETMARVPLYGYTVKNELAMKSYIKKGQSTIQGLYYRTKALEDLPEQDNLVKFISTLDYEMRVGLGIELLLKGEYFAFQEKIEVGLDKGSIRWIPLNKDHVTILITESFPQAISGYYYNDGKIQRTFEPADIVHIKFYNPLKNGLEWRGLSPLLPLSKRLSRMGSTMDASTAQMQNGGVPGIVYLKDPAYANTNVIGKMKDDYAKYLSNSSNKGAPYMSEGDLGYLSTGSPLADLQALELSQADFRAFCNTFHVPVQLFNDTNASTDNNMEWAEKRFYTATILPCVLLLKDAINKKTVYLFGNNKFVDYDISDIPALQDDMQKQATALSVMWWVTPNEKREIQKFDISEDETMNKYIIPSGMMLLDDLFMPPDINNGQGQDSNQVA